jgi:hypothetical protein
MVYSPGLIWSFPLLVKVAPWGYTTAFSMAEGMVATGACPQTRAGNRVNNSVQRKFMAVVFRRINEDHAILG